MLFLFSSCRGTFYDEQISLTAQITSKLKKEASLGPIFIDDGYYEENTKVFFLPEKEDYNKGFIVFQSNDRLRIYYLVDEYNIKGSLETYINDYFETASNYLLEPFSGSTGYLLFINYAPAVNNTCYNVIRYDELSDSNPLYEIYSNPLLGELIYNDFYSIFSSYPRIYGSYISPLDNRFYIFCQNQDTGNYHEVFYETGVPSVTPEPTQIPFSSPAPVYDEIVNIVLAENIYNACDYFYDTQKNKSVISLYAGKENIYSNYSWDAGKSPVKLSMEDHITHLLSSSLLFTRNDKTAKIYSLDGVKLYEFPMGDLRFNYETYNKNTSQYDMIFSLGCTLRTSDDWHDTQYYFYIYSWPTNELNKLE